MLTGLVADLPAQLNSRCDTYITNLDHERQLYLDFLFTGHFPNSIGKFSQNGVIVQFRTDIVETSCTDILDIVTSMGEAHSLFFYSMFFKKPVQPAHSPPVRELSVQAGSNLRSGHRNQQVSCRPRLAISQWGCCRCRGFQELPRRHSKGFQPQYSIHAQCLSS